MIVYGDRVRHVSSAEAYGNLLALVQRDEGDLDGELRTEVLLACGELTQGLLDRAFERTGFDVADEQASCSSELMMAAAGFFLHDDAVPMRALRSCVQKLAVFVDDLPLSIREPEGFAFYGVFPELYARAAARLSRANMSVQVIGIRSIGTSLAPVVARALHEARLPFTVRPVGHPFARSVKIAPDLSARLLAQREQTLYAIVDEGPGLSGSTFLSVANWLEHQGVAAQQIVFFPSHEAPPGAFASDENRVRHQRARKCYASFERHILEPSRHHPVGAWLQSAVRAEDLTFEDIGAGRWREKFFLSPDLYPACHPREERRKVLIHADEQAWLLKFVGLGARLTRIKRRAELLARRGFIAPVSDVRHGFVLEPWLADARPLSLRPVERPALVARVGAYFACIRRECSVDVSEPGARPAELLHMAKHNVRLLLGRHHASALDRFDEEMAALSASCLKLATDNRLDAHEWLVLPDGRFFKTDALDHHASHDFIGCQDLAWDVSGACVELGLNDDEREALLRVLRDQSGARFSQIHLSFYELSYLAFRASHAALSEVSLEATFPDDALRMRALKERYVRALAERIER